MLAVLNDLDMIIKVINELLLGVWNVAGMETIKGPVVLLDLLPEPLQT